MNHSIKSPHNNDLNVVVYCASSDAIDSLYVNVATHLGMLLAKNDITCINGGRNMGLMGAVNNAVILNSGRVKGVIPKFMVDSGWCHKNLTELIVTKTMHERKQTMANLADAVIALPGGVGTLEELLEIITWKQLGLYTNPIVILNINSFYDPLLEMLGKMVEQKFLHSRYRDLWKVVNTPEEAVNEIYKQTPLFSHLLKFDKA